MICSKRSRTLTSEDHGVPANASMLGIAEKIKQSAQGKLLSPYIASSAANKAALLILNWRKNSKVILSGARQTIELYQARPILKYGHHLNE